MKVAVIDITGKASGKVDLPSHVFGITPNTQVLSTYIRVAQLRSRSAKAVAQTRSDVTATTAKVWRQKGTGRARHGSRKAPIFVGGGQAHGPSGSQNYKLTVSKKVRQLALASALSLKTDSLLVVTGWEKVEAKTKSLADVLTKIGVTDGVKAALVLDQPHAHLIQAGANIKKLNITQAHRLNPLEVMKAKTIILTPEAIEALGARVTLTAVESTESKQKKS